MRVSMFSAALVAVLVGYGSTIALVLSAAAALAATPAQTASWVFAIAMAKAIGSAFLSYRHRIPIVLAWSTPGAALLVSTSGITMAEAVGAFLLAGLLIALTGAFRPLGRLIALIPDGVAGAMLAGVLLPFCMKASLAAQALPSLVLPMIAMFLLVRLKNPAIAVLAALATGVILAFISGAAHLPAMSLPLPHPTLIPPSFRLDVLLGLGIPLYLVTMAAQNLPGFATLRNAGYEPPVASALITTGAISSVAALFGAHTVNMAAITASICLSDDTHPDRAQRWKVGVIYGGFWMVVALLAPVILPVLAALPPPLMTALVALALLSPLMGALQASFADPKTRFAATVTLTTAASGVMVFGVGAAFWGLSAGLFVYALEHVKQNP